MIMVLTLTIFIDLVTAVGVILCALTFIKHMVDEQLESLEIATP